MLNAKMVLVVAFAFLLWMIAASLHPQRPWRLDDRYGYGLLLLVMAWGVRLCASHWNTNRAKANLVLIAITITGWQLVFRDVGAHVKNWLLQSAVDPFYWEAILTFAISLPTTIVYALLFAAVFVGEDKGEETVGSADTPD